MIKKYFDKHLALESFRQIRTLLIVFMALTVVPILLFFFIYLAVRNIEIFQEIFDATGLDSMIAGNLGGGGFILFYVEPERQSELLAALKDLIYVNFNFETDGSQIIYFRE